MNRICVYTCITGDYDDLKPIQKEKGIDYVCFTNNLNIVSEDWEIQYISNEGFDDLCLSRKHKILMNSYIKEHYDVCVYIDGASVIRGSIRDFLDTQCDLANYDMVIFNHSIRSCVYEEAVAIIKCRKGKPSEIRETVQYLEEQGYPHGQGLIEATILVRKTNSKNVNDTMQLWFDLFMRYAKRDQLLFDYALFKTELKVKRLDYNVFDNPWFTWKRHSKNIGFETIRIFFGDYHSIWDNNVKDIDIVAIKEMEYEYHFTVPNDCDYMEIHLGQLESGYLSKVFINDEETKFESNTTFCIEKRYLIEEEPLLLKVIRKSRNGEKICMKLKLGILNYSDYLDCMRLIKCEVEERNNAIEECKRVIDERNRIIGEQDRIINEKENEYNKLADSRKQLIKRIVKLSWQRAKHLSNPKK